MLSRLTAPNVRNLSEQRLPNVKHLESALPTMPNVEFWKHRTRKKRPQTPHGGPVAFSAALIVASSGCAAPVSGIAASASAAAAGAVAAIAGAGVGVAAAAADVVAFRCQWVHTQSLQIRRPVICHSNP